MSKDDSAKIAGLRQALNNLTGAIYNEWSDLSDRKLTTDDVLGLTDDAEACLRQIKKLSDRLKAYRGG